MKKRILSFILAICMVFTLMPNFVFAEGSASSATPSVSAYATKAQLMDDTFAPNAGGTANNIGKLVFGKNSNGDALEWYILGKDTGVSGDNTIIFATTTIGENSSFNSNKDEKTYNYSAGTGYGDSDGSIAVYANHYGASNLRNNLNSMVSDSNTTSFSATEKELLNATTVTTHDTKNNLDYTTTDRLYALEATERGSAATIQAGSRGQIAIARKNYWDNGGNFFTRTADTNSNELRCAQTNNGVNVFGVSSSYAVRPASNLNLSSALFASAATAASSSTATSGTIVSGTAMTLRLNGSSKNIGTVTYNTTKGDIKATKGSTTGDVALVVQGNDGTNDWYYSKKITGTETVNVSAVKSALGLSADIDLSACKVWLETTEDNVAYAVTVTGCSTEAELKAAIDAGEPAITLTADISLSGTLTLSDKIFTLDLAGRTITGDITLSDSSAEPQTIMTLIDSDPATGGVVKGNVTLTRGNGSASHLYANGGTITGMASMPSYAGGIYCTSDTPTAIKGYAGNFGGIYGGMFYGGINESCIKEKAVTFMNDGSRYALQVVPSGGKATTPIALKKDGYTFLGWYNGDTKYDFTQAVTENITLTAKWVLTNISTEDELRSSIDGGATSVKLVNDIKLSSALDLSKKNITIDLNGYVISGANISINTGNGKATLTLKDSRPTATHTDSTLPKGGVVTSKIAMNQSGGGYNDSVLYANGGTVTSEFGTNTNAVAVKCTSSTPTAFTGAISGYAHLYGGIYYGTIGSTVKIERKKITFQVGGNTYAYEVVDSDSGYKTVAPISPDSTKYGYQTFDGWYNGSTKYTFGSTLSANITLTAKFSNPISYNITYNLNGGTATNPTSYTVESNAITLTNPTKTGYIFTGWSGTGLSGENNMTVTVPKGSMGNRTYTAHFKDTTAPTGEISIGANKWTEFLSNITFGLFFKDTQTVKITASDNSGDAVTIEYLLSDKALTAADLATASFTAYTGAFGINPDKKYVIYAKLTDASGNVTYLSSDGIVLDATAPVISGVENGKTYCEAQTVTVTEKYIASVTLNGNPVSLDANNQFTLSAAEGTQTIVVTDKAGNVTSVTVTVNDTGHFPEADDGDCTTPIYCSVCGLIATPALSHDFSGEWKHDDTYHWHQCQNAGCNQTDEKVAIAPDRIEATIANAEYLLDTTVKPEDITVTAYYSDGFSETVTSFTTDIDDIDMSTVGSKTITVSLTKNGGTCTDDITINVIEDHHNYFNGVCTGCGSYEPPELKNGIYQIKNYANLYWFSALVNGTLTDGTAQNTSANAVLVNDITVNSIANTGNYLEWTPIGSPTNKYIGTFDGQGHKITGLYFDDASAEYVGLFGVSNGTIKNVGVIGSYFNGKECVGGVCGRNYGTIVNCYNTSTVNGVSSVGGIVGSNFGGEIRNCYNTGAISASNYGAGGIAGYNYYATIMNCYSSAAISAPTDVGGICGASDYGTVNNCYHNSKYFKGASVGRYVESTLENVSAKTATQFTSGEVAYLLSNGVTDGTQAWYQTLGTDGYPTLDNTHGTVYCNVSYPGCVGAPGTPAYTYENIARDTEIPPHNFVDGICTICGAEQHIVIIEEDMHAEGLVLGANTVAGCKAELNTAEMYVVIKNINGVTLADSDLVGTGATITYYDRTTNAEVKTVTVVLYGDVDGDGLVGMADKDTVMLKAVGAAEIENVWFLQAADANRDGVVDAFDAALINLQIANRYPIVQKIG